MRTRQDRNPREQTRAKPRIGLLFIILAAALVVAFLLSPALNVAAQQEENAAEQETATATPEAESEVTPSPSPMPTITPTATSTRPAKPLTGLVLVPLNVRPAPAQDVAPDKGLIGGRVLEVSGRGLYGQVVRASRDGFSQTAQTGDDGAYKLSDLEPGTYSVVVDGQISTPAEGVRLEGGTAVQVDFTQIKPAAASTGSAQTPAGTATPTRTPTVTRTPVPPTPTPAATATPTPKAPTTNADITTWWNWLGFGVDLSALASHLYLGVMGGFLLFAVGIVGALLRR